LGRHERRCRDCESAESSGNADRIRRQSITCNEKKKAQGGIFRCERSTGIYYWW
jgi:hypothetical protein